MFHVEHSPNCSTWNNWRARWEFWDCSTWNNPGKPFVHNTSCLEICSEMGMQGFGTHFAMSFGPEKRMERRSTLERAKRTNVPFDDLVGLGCKGFEVACAVV